MAEPAYAVGRGKPPLHTRFRKGQSGNPSGKPGPAKLARERFARALFEALESDPDGFEHRVPEGGIARIAHRIGVDAIGGRTAAQRLVVSLLDKAHAEQEEDERQSLDELLWPDANDRPGTVSAPVEERNESGPFSLVQGKKQGKSFPPADISAATHPAPSRLEPPHFPADAADRFSLAQGKKQGKNPALRSQLLAGAAMAASAGNTRYATPPPR